MVRKERVILKDFSFRSSSDSDHLAEEYTYIFEKREYLKFTQLLKSESDRGAVLITMAVVDEILESIIRSKCIIDNAKDINKLFELSSAFHTLSSKIDFLYCYGLIDSSMKKDMEILRKIRNNLAHNWEEFVIDDTFEKNYLSKFHINTLLANILEGMGIKENKEYIMPARMKFNVIASMLISLVSIIKK